MTDNPNYNNEHVNQLHLGYQSFPENHHVINPTEASAMQADNASGQNQVYTELTNRHQLNTRTEYYPTHHNYSHPPPQPEQMNNTRFHSTFEETVLASMAEIKTELTEIKKMVQISNEGYENDFSIPPGFPLKTLAEFDEFEKETNKDGRIMMQNYLKSYEGRSHRDALNYYIRVIMTMNQAEEFNWTRKTIGENDKRCLMETKTSKIFWRALKLSFRHSKPTIEGFEKDMTEVLRSYKQSARNARRPEKSAGVRARKRQKAQDIFGNDDSE